MASFEAKIGWKWSRKRENKNYRSSQNRLEKAQREKIKIIVSFRSDPTRRVRENSKKNSKKIQKIKRYRYGFISSQNRLEKAEKEKK